MGLPAQNKISSPQASLARFRKGDRPGSLSLHPLVSTDHSQLGSWRGPHSEQAETKESYWFFQCVEGPASDSPSGLCVPEKWLPAHLDLCPSRAQLPGTESAGFNDLAQYALAPSVAPADSRPGVPGRGGGLPMTAALTGRRHLSHSPGAASKLVVCPPPQEACLLPSGPGLPEPQVCRGWGGGWGSRLWGHPQHSPPVLHGSAGGAPARQGVCLN
ncbi:unnamed protein product [Rangifer tarandus platyrhynchus]|uniref:Uncharacterized protein n=2 Tax=Rangifer tarandus platyrhynchus TaxID=3082113 RepID=A0AC59YLJ1_RANTA|nr:unnamed protein product [Rangifer tarandus platyrhynchus]